MPICTTASLQGHRRIRRYREKHGDGLCFKFNAGGQFLCVKTTGVVPCFLWQYSAAFDRIYRMQKKGEPKDRSLKLEKSQC